MRMVRSVPQGGNWKNIPESIPSKRLDQIRLSGGRTTLYGRLAWDKASYTVTTYFNRPGNGTYIHPEEDRVISAREAARLQSFPDSFIFAGSKTSYCKQIGNAVPPLLSFALASRIKSLNPSLNRVVDLFSGAGGLSLGFDWAGFDIIAANDNLAPACQTYRLNHPETAFVEGDITDESIKSQLYQAIGNEGVDLVIGGPPCQGFSHAGKRAIDDPRNFLYKEFVQVVAKLRPPMVVVENVEGILTINGGKTFADIKEDFKKLGYNVAGKKLIATHYGVPQKRKRVIIVGVLEGDPQDYFPEPLIANENEFLTVRDAISNLPTIAGLGDNELLISLTPETKYQEFLAGLLAPESLLSAIDQTLPQPL